MKKIIILLLISSTFLTACAFQSKDNDKNIEQNSNTQISTDNTKVNAKVKVFDGSYRDNKVFTSATLLKNYTEIIVSNVTETTFDFIIYQVVDSESGDKEVLIDKNTATFIGDGTIAIYEGKEYTLNFTFPNYHNSLPVVTDIEVTGVEQFKGNTYTNNGLPGHEFN